MRVLRSVIVLVAVTGFLLVAEPAHAADEPCGGSASIRGAVVDCYVPTDSSGATSVADGRVVEYRDVCGLGGGGVNTCYEVAECTEDGEQGTLVDVYIDGEFSGKSCLTPGAAENLAVITPGLVLREFQRLSWPDSELQVQPVDQRTAVNWETFFFTDNTAPHTQTVTLLGQQVTIEATPSEYVWRFGAGASARTTSPGGPYPAGDVTHVYRSEGSASPSVDTVYTGRYRVNGGRWIDIPAPLTVAGDPVTLQVIEIGPRLVTPPTY